MTIPYRKKLIEVALPLDAINRACVDDKNRKTGHIRNIHKWFAPMPLPAWRAILFSSLVDDPGNSLPEKQAAKERKRLFGIIERMLPFEAIHDRNAFVAAHSEIRGCLGDALPTITDPFCGGGSTVLEAQRLGLPTFASDLNPVPVLITKMLAEIPPKIRGLGPFGSDKAPNLNLAVNSELQGFVADVHTYADRIRERAYAKLAQHYPLSSSDETIVAWRWARTVASPDPNVRRGHTPLVSDWMLSKTKSETCWVEPVINDNCVSYTIGRTGNPPLSSIGRGGGRCVLSKAPIPLTYVRSEAKAGRMGVHLMASVVDGEAGRGYEAPTERQLFAVESAQTDGLTRTPLPGKALGFRVQEYGFNAYEDLFTDRQLLALSTFADLVAEIREEIISDALGGLPLQTAGNEERAVVYADALVTFFGLCIGRLAQSNNSLIRWAIDPRNGSAKAVPAFDRHALAMIWDFTEVNPFGGSVGDWTKTVDTALRALPLVNVDGPSTDVRQLDARQIGSAGIQDAAIATDPPYFANIGYADLSDFFYVWLRRALQPTYPRLFATITTPKSDELIATPFRHSGGMEAAKDYFQRGFEDVFSSIAQFQRPDIPISVVYAFKQEEGDGEKGDASTGWEAMLEGLIRSNLAVVATWPLRTNRATRMIGLGTNSLASAIVILCRVRSTTAVNVSRRDFLTSLRNELPAALRSLQEGNIAPVDLAQAAIGPGMAVFSRYSRVLEADGTPMDVRTALTLINQTLDEVLAEQEGEFEADTRWALAWFDQSGFSEGSYGYC